MLLSGNDLMLSTHAIKWFSRCKAINYIGIAMCELRTDVSINQERSNALAISNVGNMDCTRTVTS